MHGTPTHRAWQNMRLRCLCPGTNGYKNYGGRGIKVCRRWYSFPLFVKDMGPKPEGTTLDRIDNDGNYGPGNCRWSPRHAQDRNKRNNVNIKFNGITMVQRDWARAVGLSPQIVSYRIKAGWSVDAALTTKPRKTGR